MWENWPASQEILFLPALTMTYIFTWFRWKSQQLNSAPHHPSLLNLPSRRGWMTHLILPGTNFLLHPRCQYPLKKQKNEWVYPDFYHFCTPILVGRGDNLQLFISPLLKYEEWLYNIIDDKNYEINSLEPSYRGLKITHTPIGTCRNSKNENTFIIIIHFSHNQSKIKILFWLWEKCVPMN